jgi:hypothetical protein
VKPGELDPEIPDWGAAIIRGWCWLLCKVFGHPDWNIPLGKGRRPTCKRCGAQPS